MTQITDRFQAAVFELVGEGSVKSRLIQAYTRHLQDLEEDLLPEDLRGEFIALRESLHERRPVGGESAVEASVRKMSSRDAEASAADILTTLLRLLRGNVAVERLRVVNGREPAAVGDAGSQPPAFLAERR
jgi:hypothetical protein